MPSPMPERADRPRLGLILDLDRTLVALPLDIVAVRGALAAWGAARGIDSPWRPILEEMAALPGRLRPRWGEGAEVIAEEAMALFDGWELAAAAAAIAMPHAAQVLTRAQEAGVPAAVVTNNGRLAAEAALAASGLPRGPIRAMVCRRETPLPKPHPEGMRRALAALEVAAGPLDTLACVGDSPMDVEAARALAGELTAAERSIRVVTAGVTTGYASAEALAASRPDILLDDLGALWDKLPSPI